MTTVSFRAKSDELIKDIDAIATRMDRPRTWVINDMLANAVSRQKELDRIIAERIAYADTHPEDRIPHEDVMKRVRKRLKARLGT